MGGGWETPTLHAHHVSPSKRDLDGDGYGRQVKSFSSFLAEDPEDLWTILGK